MPSEKTFSSKATNYDGDLFDIPNCYITIEGKTIFARVMPEVSDQKSASYNDESIIGRSFPIKTFSHSENRLINVEWHFITLKKGDIEKNLKEFRLIQSATYPRDGFANFPYRPPPICRIRCGQMLGDQDVCVILRSYSVKFPTDQVFEPDSLLPYKFSVSLSLETVYPSSDLPGQDRIAREGR